MSCALNIGTWHVLRQKQLFLSICPRPWLQELREGNEVMSISQFPCCAPDLHSPVRHPVLLPAQGRLGFQFKLWPTTNYQPQCPWAVIDSTKQRTNIPRKTPLLGYRAAAAAHSPLQGKVMLTSLLTVSSIPRIPCEAASSANQDRTELALKSSSCETFSSTGLEERIQLPVSCLQPLWSWPIQLKCIFLMLNFKMPTFNTEKLLQMLKGF